MLSASASRTLSEHGAADFCDRYWRTASSKRILNSVPSDFAMLNIASSNSAGSSQEKVFFPDCAACDMFTSN